MTDAFISSRKLNSFNLFNFENVRELLSSDTRNGGQDFAIKLFVLVVVFYY